MKYDRLYPLIQQLYTGAPGDSTGLLQADLMFRDPIVMVKGRAHVLAMFRKLNWMFPYTDVARLELHSDNHEGAQWNLTVNYRAWRNSKPTIFQTELVLVYDSGTIVQLTEHWRKPLRWQGDSESRAGKTVRKILGRGLGLSICRKCDGE